MESNISKTWDEMMNKYLLDMINSGKIKPIEEVYWENKHLDKDSIYNLLVEYLMEFYNFGVYAAGVFAHGYLKDKGINLPFVV